jgi:hypothetical protein
MNNAGAIAAYLYSIFITEKFSPRKKDFKVEKTIKRAWSMPHQGRKEKARRMRQLADGIIRN